MKTTALFVALLLVSTALTAAPQTQAGQGPGPTVVIVSGSQGAVRLVHEGAVVREIPMTWTYAGAVILPGPLDTAEWDGAPGLVLPPGDDPEGRARQILQDRPEALVFLLKPDGTVDALKAPDDWVDATTAASAEE